MGFCDISSFSSVHMSKVSRNLHLLHQALHPETPSAVKNVFCPLKSKRPLKPHKARASQRSMLPVRTEAPACSSVGPSTSTIRRRSVDTSKEPRTNIFTLGTMEEHSVRILDLSTPKVRLSDEYRLPSFLTTCQLDFGIAGGQR